MAVAGVCMLCTLLLRALHAAALHCQAGPSGHDSPSTHPCQWTACAFFLAGVHSEFSGEVRQQSKSGASVAQGPAYKLVHAAGRSCQRSMRLRRPALATNPALPHQHHPQVLYGADGSFLSALAPADQYRYSLYWSVTTLSMVRARRASPLAVGSSGGARAAGRVQGPASAG